VAVRLPAHLQYDHYDDQIMIVMNTLNSLDLNGNFAAAAVAPPAPSG
jgi:hypothetical protein